jgi:hypothetical protein
VLLHYRLHTGSICHTRESDQQQIRPLLEAEVYQRRALARPAEKPDEPPPRSLNAPGERFTLWGWWALIGGNIATARRYAFRAVRLAPFTPDTWRLLYCSLRGR